MDKTDILDIDILTTWSIALASLYIDTWEKIVQISL